MAVFDELGDGGEDQPVVVAVEILGRGSEGAPRRKVL
jgi:hypothetical protein